MTAGSADPFGATPAVTPAPTAAPAPTAHSGDVAAPVSPAPSRTPQPTKAPVPTKIPAVTGGEPAPQEPRENLLVGDDWLRANLGKVVLIDGRAQSLYLKGHIPGAVNAEWTYFTSLKGRPGDRGWGDLLPRAQMAKRLGALGIDGKKPVVVYADRGGWGQDGWILWILRSMGLKSAKILDGGFTAWVASGGKTDKWPVKPKAVSLSLPKPDDSWNVSTQWIVDHMDHLKILDVRTKPEFEGARFFQERRGGHIPGAIHLPFDQLVDGSGKLHTNEQLREIFHAAGLQEADDIVVYDTAGVRGAYATLMLRLAGFTKAKNYDSGFQEWAGDKDLEVATGSGK